MRRTGSVAILAALLASPAVTAQEPQFQTAVPESPAFTFLGVSPNLVSRPASVRDLGAALLTGVNGDGAAQQGFALDVTPWIFIPGLDIPLADYGASVWKRGLANLQLSFGTVATAGEPSSTDAALGLRTTLFDGTDGMQQEAFTGPVAAGLRGCASGVRPGLSEEEAEQAIQLCADSVMATAWEDWEAYSREHWNASFFAVGIGMGGQAPDSRPGRARYSGLKGWLVGGFGVGAAAQLLGQLTVSDRPERSGAPGARELTFGGRVLFGSASFHAFAEAAGVWRSERPGPDSDGLSWSGGLELRLADGMWASTGFGQRYRGLGEADRLVVLLGLGFGVVSRSRVTGLRP
jgi:hypothetical protein